jgi:hypothetical protein
LERRTCKGVLPHAQYLPAAFVEEQVDGPIALLVASYLRIPEVLPRFGHTAVPAAAVPEAAVNKDGEALPRKTKSGRPGKGCCLRQPVIRAARKRDANFISVSLLPRERIRAMTWLRFFFVKTSGMWLANSGPLHRQTRA